MGLGISIKLNDTITDYKFDFRFKDVKIWKISSNVDKTDTTLFRSISEENGWVWKNENDNKKVNIKIKPEPLPRSPAQ
jgi:hypothetical protein